MTSVSLFIRKFAAAGFFEPLCSRTIGFDFRHFISPHEKNRRREHPTKRPHTPSDIIANHIRKCNKNINRTAILIVRDFCRYRLTFNLRKYPKTAKQTKKSVSDWHRLRFPPRFPFASVHQDKTIRSGIGYLFIRHYRNLIYSYHHRYPRSEFQSEIMQSAACFRNFVPESFQPITYPVFQNPVPFHSADRMSDPDSYF